MEKYLKMSDVFPKGVLAYHGEEYNGWSIIESVGGDSIDESGDGGFESKTADYVAHAINTHDELVAMNKELLAALEHLHYNAKSSGAEMGLALDVAEEAIHKAKDAS